MAVCCDLLLILGRTAVIPCFQVFLLSLFFLPSSFIISSFLFANGLVSGVLAIILLFCSRVLIAVEITQTAVQHHRRAVFAMCNAILVVYLS